MRNPVYSIYEARLESQLDKENIPKHIAVMLDGNRRWADKNNGSKAKSGHVAGAQKIFDFLSWCDELNVPVITLYLLSTENLKQRSQQELQDLFVILEELAKGLSKESAIVNTMKTAGKTVFYSGLTVVVTLISLMFFPLNFLKSMGYAGASVVALAVFGALIPLPALLVMLGEKVNKGRVRRGALIQREDGRWAQVARFVMRKPITVVAASLAILFFFISPIGNAKFGQVDTDQLPATDRRLGKPLPYQQANQTRALPKVDKSFYLSAYRVLATVSSCYPLPKGRFSRVTHPSATKIKNLRTTCMC